MKDIHTFVILAHNESLDLEECIKFVLKQNVKSNVVIATSTKNDFIMDLASKYGLGVMENNKKSNKGRDYNFALDSFNTELITIAHQDDLYDRNYTKEILNCYKNNKDASIIFTDYYEIKKDKKIYKSKEMFYKKMHLLPLKYSRNQNKIKWKLFSLKYGKMFCTSSVTFVKKNIKENMFPCNMNYNNDWKGFIDLANSDSKFVYLDKKLVGYRVEKKEFNEKQKKEDIKLLSLYNKDKIVNKIIKRRYGK